MSRITLINLHLFVTSVFLPFMLILPLSGALKLLGYEGEATKTSAFESNATVPEDESARADFFREEFKKAGVDFDFEYIRGSGKEFIFRPATRTHYVAAKKDDGGIAFTKIEPNFAKVLLELHKGHGPRLMKWVEAAFGIMLILSLITGVWLGLGVRMYRGTMLSAFTLGTFITVVALLI